LAKSESVRNNDSMIRPSQGSEKISEATTKEEISMKNGIDTKAKQKTKAGSKNKTARVMENIDLLGTVEKCGCSATNQVPVQLFLDKLKKIEKIKKVDAKVEVKIFKVELDVDADPVSDQEVADKTKKSLREKPLRLPLTSIRCGGFQPKKEAKEEKEEGGSSREEPELVENEDVGEIPVAINATALMEEHNLETVQRVNDSKASRTIPYKVNNARVGGAGEEPQRVMVTVPYKMPVRISKDETGEAPVPLNCHQALPYQLREAPQQVPRSVALEGEMSSGAHRITS